MSTKKLKLLRHVDTVSVVKLGPADIVPEWALSDSPILSIIATPSATTVVTSTSAIPTAQRRIGPYVCFEVAGPVNIYATGIIEQLIIPIAAAGIGVFNQSTANTNWMLVPDFLADNAQELWEEAGHCVEWSRTPQLTLPSTNQDMLPLQWAGSKSNGMGAASEKAVSAQGEQE